MNKETLQQQIADLEAKLAHMSLTRNKVSNRLEALAEQLGGLKEFELGDKNYYIYYDFSIKEWGRYHTELIYEPGVVYITKECAIEILRMLNTGEFSLDGEI